jgi:hypothetical protein
MKGIATPRVMDESVVRSEDVIQLFDQLRVKDTVALISDPVVCQAFRRFLLYIKLKSTSTPTTIRYEVQFLDDWAGEWNTYKQGLFAALYFEDADTASGINECFEGQCMGRAIRVKLTGLDCTSAAYFVTSVSVEFRN